MSCLRHRLWWQVAHVDDDWSRGLILAHLFQTDEKLQTLSQEQLLNLLDNLDRQRKIGRVAAGTGEALDQRIAALLTGRNGARRRKQLSVTDATASTEQA